MSVPARLAPLLLGSALALAACKGEQTPPAAASSTAQRYTFRGEVVRLADPGVRRPELTLRHERIPDFVNAEGKAVGMDAMVMPFEVAPAATPADLKVGDKVEVRLAVDWAGPSFRLEQVSKLPADTKLDLGKGAAR
jgi:Cu/Ag efflux protein CusF